MRVLKKEDIIKALQEEPLLAHGRFAQPVEGYDRDDKPTKENCKVCAVGAILRNGFETIRDFNKAVANATPGWVACKELIPKYLAKKQYLSALSCYFEDRSDDEGPKETLEDLIAFVEKNFPDTIEVNI